MLHGGADYGGDNGGRSADRAVDGAGFVNAVEDNGAAGEESGTSRTSVGFTKV